jgi:hypothetical protein
MLTIDDIEFMKESRNEMAVSRQSAITLIYQNEGTKDLITGEVTDPIDIPFETLAVVTEISSQVKIDRYLQNGIEVEKGDICFSVSLDAIEIFYEQIINVLYDSKKYEVISKDKKGIGKRNRAEFVGRLVT